MRSNNPKPIIAWRMFMNRDSKYGSLDIEVMPVFPRNDYDGSQRPFPLFDQPFSKESLVIHFQSNPESPNDWYGGRIKLEKDRMTFDSVLLPWLKRHHKEAPGYIESPRAILETLITKGMRVFYSSTFNNFIEAKHFDASSKLRCYYDTNVPGKNSSGCTINAYAPEGSSQEEITAAVSKALRDSSYCTDEQFVGWVNAGSTWAASPGSQQLHRPFTMEEIFGPATQEAAA